MANPFLDDNVEQIPTTDQIVSPTSDLHKISEKNPFAKEPEPGLERVGIEEYFIPGLKGYGAITGLAAGVSKYAKPGVIKEVAKQLVPKTGKELAAGAIGSSLGGAAVIKGEEMIPERYAKYRPLVGLAPLLLGGSAALGYKLGRGPTPSIPKERIEAGRFMKEKKAPPSYEQLQKGKESRASIGKLTQQQASANEIYNETLGLPPNKLFGTEEFIKAKNNLNKEYDNVLKGQKVTFGKGFFDTLDSLLKNQQSLQQSGITFGQSKAIIGALEKIGAVQKLPQKLQDAIKNISRVSEEQISPEESQRALSVLNQLLPELKKQPDISMPATAYNEIRSILGDAAARTSNNRDARLLRAIQEQFDNAADNSLPQEIAQRLNLVRLRWEALKTLEEAQLKSESGIISPEAVGQAIKNRLEQGSIYGRTNLLTNIGRAGTSLGISAPATGRELFESSQRGLTPHSTTWGVIRDILSLPTYPIKRALVNRRLSEPDLGRTLRRSTLPAGAAAAAGYGRENEQ